MSKKEELIEEMTKQEQIEEMAKTMCLFCKEMTEEKDCERGKECFDWRLKEARFYYEQGCRIINKDSVVLSMEEWECLHNDYAKALYNARQQARKETAKEILDLIAKIMKEEYGDEPPCNFNCNDEYMFDNCDEFCCEYCNTPDNEKNYERCWIEFLKAKMKDYGFEVAE